MSEKQNVAYTRRNYFLIFCRFLRHLFLRGLQRIVAGDFSGWNLPERIVILPVVDNRRELEIIIQKIHNYLPGVDIPVYIKTDVQLDLSQQDFAVNIILDESVMPGRKDWVLLHKFTLSGMLYFLLNIRHSVIVDPYYYSTAESTYWQSLLPALLPAEERKGTKKINHSIWEKMWTELGGCSTAYCFLTGPSISEALDFKYKKDSIRIICNSIVSNPDLVARIKPSILVFADPVFHFGPSRYALKFRDCVLQVVAEYNCWVVVPDGQDELVRRQLPSISEKIIGVRSSGKAVDSGWKASRSEPLIGSGGVNVLTSYMLPMAASLASKEVVILGADGRKKSEKYFWSHSPAAQFTAEMDSVFECHPSFFRDRSYVSFYKGYCKKLTWQVEQIEKDGIDLRSLTRSYVPCLADRYFDGRNSGVL